MSCNLWQRLHGMPDEFGTRPKFEWFCLLTRSFKISDCFSKCLHAYQTNSTPIGSLARPDCVRVANSSPYGVLKLTGSVVPSERGS